MPWDVDVWVCPNCGYPDELCECGPQKEEEGRLVKCYYDNLGYCDYFEALWQCQTCKEWFCDYHWHQTELGHCVECTACEYARKEEANSG